MQPKQNNPNTRSNLTVEMLLKTFPDGLTHQSGALTTAITEITPPNLSHETALVFASSEPLLKEVLSRPFGALCIPGNLVKDLPVETNAKAVIIYKDISAAFAYLFPLFARPHHNTSKNNYVTYVDPTAKIGQNVVIEPFAMIGQNVVIGDDCHIGANTVIEQNTKIGNGTYLYPQVFIGHHTEIGKNCIVHPNTTIGGDGFGFARLKSGEMKKIPQLGIVVIEDDVEIGGNSTVDRATLTETRIGHGTKLDKHCHVAHNCIIGPNNVLAAGFWIAGSSTTGSQVTAGGAVDVSDHISITNNVMLAGRTAVTNDINEPGAYGGYPLQPIKLAIKNTANIGHLTTMRKQLKQIMKHLGLNDEE